MQRTLRIAMAALPLLLMGACAPTPVKVNTFLPLGQAAVLPAPQTTSPTIAIPEAIPPAGYPLPEIAATMIPDLAAAEIVVFPATPEPTATASRPDYFPSFASYYARRFEGRRTATGERYDPTKMTAATRDFPLNSWLKVINPANGREVIVRINDRTGKRKTPLVDLSRAAAKELDFLGKGKIRVHVIPLPPAR